jgi:hypothetical protein
MCHEETHAPQQTKDSRRPSAMRGIPDANAIECLEKLDPCPEREPVGHHIRKVAGVHGGTIQTR